LEGFPVPRHILEAPFQRPSYWAFLQALGKGFGEACRLPEALPEGIISNSRDTFLYHLIGISPITS